MIPIEVKLTYTKKLQVVLTRMKHNENELFSRIQAAKSTK